MRSLGFIQILLVATLASHLFSDETSVFDGLASSVGTTQNVEALNAEIKASKESIDGIRSVVDGLSANNQKLNIRLNDLESLLSNDINTQILELKKAQLEQNEKLNKLTQAVTVLATALQSKESQKAKKAEPKPNKTSQNNENFASMPASAVFESAQKNFDTKKYDNAKAAFEYLIQKNYRPAYSNFMLGEIAYAKKLYKEAIPYYRTSVNLYDKGSYMPRLLYHTAISCDKIGDKQSANKFYSTLKVAYPDSDEAKKSPIRK